MILQILSIPSIKGRITNKKLGMGAVMVFVLQKHISVIFWQAILRLSETGPRENNKH